MWETSAYIVLYAAKARHQFRQSRRTPGGGETVYALTKVDQETARTFVGKANRNPNGGSALFVHIWAEAVALQSVHGCHCHLLHKAA